ncbi:hypothetical protein ACQKKK_15485 [Peribacillus sp. NPDC006672]|uniref:hypothetical protein n=1 Tax=Peribacillus sp. NPDC006672 TaxID=3390606 RepID=UPI003CFF8C2B
MNFQSLFVGIVFSPISIQTNQSLDYAKENGLSTTEINNLQQALIEISSEDLNEIESATELLRRNYLNKTILFK